MASGSVDLASRVKIKEKVKAKQCTSTIVEDDGDLLPPALALGKQLADVLAGFSPQELNEVVGHLSPGMLQNWVCQIWTQHQTVFSRLQFFGPLVFQNFNSSCDFKPPSLGSSILKPDDVETALLHPVSNVSGMTIGGDSCAVSGKASAAQPPARLRGKWYVPCG